MTEEKYADIKPNFIPKILLCGDEREFSSRTGDRQVKIVGHGKISGTFNGQKFDFANEGKLLFNDKIQELPALKDFLQSPAVDYFVFNDIHEFIWFTRNTAKRGFHSFKIITTEEFNSLPQNFFYDVDAETVLMSNLKINAIEELLDIDGYFAHGKLFTKQSNDLTAIDCVSDEPVLPIKENIYTRTYKNLAEVGFKRYGAALIIERTPADFDDIFNRLENISDVIITFAQNNSELEKHLTGKGKDFDLVKSIPTNTGKWYFLNRFKPPQDFAVYVVTHKPTPHEGKLPAGYKIIQAGHALNPDLSYIGDDTGDNISKLNPYLNETTALYWMWKNTSHKIIGLNHYRRFFTDSYNASFSYEKILNKDNALKILKNYDIIVCTLHIGYTQRENIQFAVGKSLTTICETTIKKYLVQSFHADYIDAFNYVLSSKSFYKCNVFITRQNIFNAYCEWLFSFIVDATEEILRTLSPEELVGRKQRAMGFFSEIMPTIWLIKNRLKIKELNLMFLPGI